MNKHITITTLTYNFYSCILALLILLTASACGRPDADIHRRTQFLMGTLVEITVRYPDKEKANRAIDGAFDEMKRLEGLMSSHLPDSEISRLNRSAGGDFLTVSPEVLEVMRSGIRWARVSEGALDITIGPVDKLWRFDEDSKSLPDPEALARAVGLVDYRDIQIEDGKVRLARPGMALRLGAIAKGYAVDRAVAALKSSGIRHALINAGGDLMAIGTREKERPWRIGLQHPRNPEKMIASFALSDKAVATSGDYQKYFIKDGVRYHHILHPANGEPVQGVISATVITDTVMDADALATAVFVLGADKGMALIESLKGVEAMVVTESGSPRFSGNFQSQPEFAFQGLEDNPAH